MAIPVIMPRQGQSVESCILIEWLRQPGDAVEEGAPLAGIETDKATFEVPAPVSGTLLECFFEAGDDIPVLTNIAAMGEPGEDVSALRPAAPPDESRPPAATALPPAAAPSAATDAVAPGEDRGVSPRARTTARQKLVEVNELAGTGPGGRVIERDVLLAVEQRVAPAPPTPLEGGEEIPVTGIRKLIADRMLDSLQSTAQLTLHRGVNVGSLLRYREMIKARAARGGLPNITVNDLIAFVTARTLAEHPQLNAHFLGDRIVQYRQVNLGIAVDTPRGLMVPVVKNAAGCSLPDLSGRIRGLADTARDGKSAPDDLQGGTFTITNLGALGVETFTPVLNVPEVAILGVGGLTLKPIRVEDRVEFVDCIDLSLTVDHQAVDGAPAARFLDALAVAIECLELTFMQYQPLS